MRLIWVHASSHFDQTRLRSRASCKIHGELEIHPRQMTAEHSLFKPPLCTSTPPKSRREEVVSSLCVCRHSFSPIYNSDRSVCACVVQTVLSALQQDQRQERPRRLARHDTSRLPTRGPWGRGSLFLLYRLGIVCRISWARHALPTCFFQSREGTACFFLPLRLTLWLPCRNTKFLQRNSRACQSLWAKGAAINEYGGARKENKDVFLEYTLWKTSVSSGA